MSLIKPPAMSPSKLSANQSNAQQSSGPATPPGKKRARLANLKHGIFSSVSPEILEALGEDPDELAVFERALAERWQPADPFEQALVLKIARNLWRLDRCRRAQESATVVEIARLEAKRAEQAEDHEAKMAATLEALKEILRLVRQGDFSDPDSALAAFQRAYAGLFGRNMKEIADLMEDLWPDLEITLSPAAVDFSQLPGAFPPDQPAVIARLQVLLEEELEAMRLYDRDYRQRIEITPAQRAARMGPVQEHAPSMIRQEESLARQVERDVRLLYFVRARDREGTGPGPEGGNPPARQLAHPTSDVNPPAAAAEASPPAAHPASPPPLPPNGAGSNHAAPSGEAEKGSGSHDSLARTIKKGARGQTIKQRTLPGLAPGPGSCHAERSEASRSEDWAPKPTWEARPTTCISWLASRETCTQESPATWSVESFSTSANPWEDSRPATM